MSISLTTVGPAIPARMASIELAREHILSGRVAEGEYIIREAAYAEHEETVDGWEIWYDFDEDEYFFTQESV